MDEEFIEATVAKLLAYGLIEEAPEASYASQIHIAKTPGREMRFTIDYRRLNKQTKADAFPLPRMDDLLYGFSGAKFFSTVDAQRGFWQIGMGKGKELTAFRTSRKCYRWKRMPLGLCNAPATFQKFMSSIFEDMDFVKVYIDDIIIGSQSVKDHLNHIERVLQRCVQMGVTLKASKCHFLKIFCLRRRHHPRSRET